jgi:hypothetical protein
MHLWGVHEADCCSYYVASIFRKSYGCSRSSSPAPAALSDLLLYFSLQEPD